MESNDSKLRVLTPVTQDFLCSFIPSTTSLFFFFFTFLSAVDARRFTVTQKSGGTTPRALHAGSCTPRWEWQHV